MRGYPPLIAALWLLAAPVRAEEWHPCRADRQRFCAQAKTPSKRVQCLKAHENELSPVCRDAFALMRSMGDEFEDACGENAQHFCAGLQSRLLLDCLEKNGPSLDPGCLSAIQLLKRNRKEFHERIPVACRSEAEGICSGVQPGEGRLTACLNAHADRLSAVCLKALREDEKAQ